MNRRHAPRGVMFIDLVVSLSLALALLTMTAMAIGRLHHGEQQLSDARSQMRQLEAAMLALQSGGVADPTVALQRLPDPAPSGKVWVRVTLPNTAAVPGNPPMLVGLIPADKLPGGAP